MCKEKEVSEASREEIGMGVRAVAAEEEEELSREKFLRNIFAEKFYAPLVTELFK